MVLMSVAFLILVARESAGSSPQCPSGDFRCSNGRCILSAWKCDRRNDCGDNSDEIDCPPPGSCSSNMHACLDGQCISALWRCDGEVDCDDGSDEKDCHVTTCDPETQVRCGHGQCIPTNWVCDGTSDCHDGTDEKNCTQKGCGFGKFLCKNGTCIDQAKVCDSRKDCQDGTDEMNCTTSDTMKCRHGEFKCTNTTKCIPKLWVCDGDDDCVDKSDEPSNCMSPKFKEPPGNECDTYHCPKTDECIPWSKVCDGQPDCEDMIDEGILCFEPCPTPCVHECRHTPQGSKCSCYDGYVLSSDGVTCEDVDECSSVGTCSQFCNNTKGGYKCSCAEGYLLEYDRRRCKVEGGTPYLTFIQSDEIRGIALYSPYTIRLHRLNETAEGLDWDSNEGTFYWADRKKKTINWWKNDTSYGVLVNTLEEPHFLRRDWLTSNIYYTDDEGCIVCCSGDGKYCATVYTHAAPDLNTFDIAPMESLMFWTSWNMGYNSLGRIERAELDGSNRKVIVSENIEWVSAFTVDHVLKMIYWIDTQRSMLECADFNGLKRRVVVSKGLDQPFSMTVFEDYLYWSDWGTGNLMRCNKFEGKNCTKLYHGSVKAEVLLVEHRVTQPKGTNRCAASGCPQLCLPTASNFVCKCDDHFLSVQSGCQPDPVALSTESCPSDYCLAGAECVVLRSRFICICPPSYQGDRCDEFMVSGNDSSWITPSPHDSSWITSSPHNSSWIVGVVLAVLLVCLIFATAFFFRGKLAKMGQTVAVSFRKAGHRRSRLTQGQQEDENAERTREGFQEVAIPELR